MSCGIAPFVEACAGGWGWRAACSMTSLVAGELLMELIIWKLLSAVREAIFSELNHARARLSKTALTFEEFPASHLEV